MSDRTEVPVGTTGDRAWTARLSRRQLLRGAALAAAAGALSPARALAGDVIVDDGRSGKRVDLRYRARDYRISVLTYRRLPYTNYPLEPLVPAYPQDEDGVIMYRWREDGKLYYHPVQMAQKGLMLVDNYRTSGVEAYLTRAQAIAARIRAVGVSDPRGLYLPYWFPITHGDYFPVPWYSGMAQGQATSFFVRLYEATGRSSYLQAARQVYRPLAALGRADFPWVAYVDSGRNLWFEEYPQSPPDHVLNGFNFAIFGVYDWYRVTRDTAVKRHLRGAITTVRNRVSAYRVPGGVSYYCLGQKVQMLLYHEIHIRQLRMLRRIADEPWFDDFADVLAADTGSPYLRRPDGEALDTAFRVPLAPPTER